jgi:hypothetical protein
MQQELESLAFSLASMNKGKSSGRNASIVYADAVTAALNDSIGEKSEAGINADADGDADGGDNEVGGSVILGADSVASDDIASAASSKVSIETPPLSPAEKFELALEDERAEKAMALQNRLRKQLHHQINVWRCFLCLPVIVIVTIYINLFLMLLSFINSMLVD